MTVGIIPQKIYYSTSHSVYDVKIFVLPGKLLSVQFLFSLMLNAFKINISVVFIT